MKKELLCTITLLASVGALAAPYELDVSHSEVGFSVKHMMVSKVRGDFRDFKGTFDFDDAKGLIKNIDVEIKVVSIDTRNTRRDSHLKSPEIFDSEKYPLITFKSDSLTVKENEATKIKGALTMHGVTKPIELEVTYNGKVTDPNGVTKAGFVMTGKINRKDFGVSYNHTLDKGGVLISEDVDLDISGEVAPVKATK